IAPFVINEDRVKENAEEPVVADPLISKHLRDHQKEGVRFIYSHLREQGGVILADEMGLGKSIQAIVATMALLKQPMIVTVKRASDITTYACSVSTYPYLIISYEMALRYTEKLAAVRFDILVCDEGHRLKNINGKLRRCATAKVRGSPVKIANGIKLSQKGSLDSLCIPRRLLLTGTPLQNDIEEFFSLLDFDGDFNRMISDCLLRRTGEINNTHLPIKNDYVLFCAPSTIQKAVLTAICDHVNGEPLVLII
ncbi:SNF2 family protein, partial [Ostertagia ostertagi]